MCFSTYPKNSQKYVCNTQQTAGLSISNFFYYTGGGFNGTTPVTASDFNTVLSNLSDVGIPCRLAYRRR
jgi:hypothetical protein